jgi:putative membrane-bound dehydrogenase-like protein
MSRWFLPLVAVAVAASCLPAVAQVPPDKSISTMTAGPGLQVELFAAEPMLINPTAIDVDDLGRVWVAEAVNYRRKNFNRPILREAGDRIVVLTDTDGDGKADKSEVFYQGKELYGPLSVLAIPQVKGGKKAGYRVLVAQSPDILEFTCSGDEPKADGPPKKFLTGFGGFDHDHGVHGLHMGPDGKLYFTVGDQGLKGVQSADGKGRKFISNNTDCQAGTVWRCDLQGNNLELIAHNFRNNYEACVDSFGEIWLSDNDDDGNQQTRICHVLPGGNYGYFPRGAGQTHWHEEQPGIVHKTLRTGFGSPTGIQFYEGSLLPKQYHNTLMHTDAGPRELRAFTRKPKGAGYELDKVNMLTSTDNWFRPSDVCTAPDGSVFVADWYDPGVGGHGMGDHTRGRIYRVTPAGHKGYAVPGVRLDTKEGFLSALDSSCLTTRALAISYMYDRVVGNKEMTLVSDMAAVVNKVKRTPDVLRARSHWAFLNIQDYELRKTEAAYSAKIHGIQGIRMLEIADVTMFAEVKKLPDTVTSNSPVLTREWLILMRKFSAADVIIDFYSMASQYVYNESFAGDLTVRAALNIACGTDPTRRDAILADFGTHFPEWNDKVADLVWELQPKSMLPKLGELLKDAKLTAPQKARIVDILAASPELDAGKSMLALLTSEQPAEVKARALENLRLFLPTKWNGLAKSGELATATTALLKSDATRLTGLQLVAAAKFSAGRAEVAAIARDDQQPTATRVEAIRTLGQLPSADSLKTLIEVGSPENSLSIDCVKAIGLMLPNGSKVDATAKEALDSLKKAVLAPKATTELSRVALAVLAGNRAGTQWLLEAKQKNELPEALSADAGKLLRNSPFQGERNKASLLFPAPGKLNPKNLPTAAALATRTGDAANGKKLMAASLVGESQCLKCHMVRGQGGQIGPDLSMIGKKGSRENLFESILLPSKAIADQYVSWAVATADGQAISGLLVGETETTVTIRDANGKDYAIAVKDIEKRAKSLVSIMPEGLAATLTEDELVDLVEYLTQLQTASLTPDSWLIAGPFPAASMEAALARDDKPTDWRLVKNATAYLDLAALHGDKSANSATYARKEFDSPVSQDATILLGTDDGAKLWVNGVEVYTHSQSLAAAPEQHSVNVKLKAGTNTVTLKVANGNNPHGFYFAITSGQELKAK